MTPKETTNSPLLFEAANSHELCWTEQGLDREWLEQRLAPICGRYAPVLQSCGQPVTPAMLEHGEGSWDLLFINAVTPAEASADSIEEQIRRIAYTRPDNAVIAVVGDTSLKRQIALLRAGALDVVSQLSPMYQLEQTVERAIDLIQARRQQAEKAQIKLINQLAIGVNHEINNPLTGLMGTAELLLIEGNDLSDKLRRDLQTIITQCHRIQEVTARLRNLTHLRSVPYGSHDRMLDLSADWTPRSAAEPVADLFNQPPHLLVVDDNPLIIDLISRLFEQRYMIDAVTSPAEALSLVEQTGYDLVLIDLIMPEMNGLDLFRAIRRLRPDQKAMLTTAYEGDARVEQAIVEGAVGCIFKPFQLEELETAITQALLQK